MRPVASVSQGSDDEVSSSSAPGLSPRSRPSSPATSACTTAPFGTIVTTMSLRAASSAGVRATCAPESAAATSSARPGAVSYSVIAWPAAARCEAIGRPITPRPIKPSDGVRDVMTFRVFTRKAAQQAGRRRDRMQANTA